MMRVVICGGRTGVNRRGAYCVLDALRAEWPADTEVGEGCAAGYDTIAGNWADMLKLGHMLIPVNNELDGNREDAPKQRNRRLLAWLQDTLRREKAVVCFPGGPGTRDMMDIALAADIPVYDVEFENGQFTVYLLPAKGSGEKATKVATGAIKR